MQGCMSAVNRLPQMVRPALAAVLLLQLLLLPYLRPCAAQQDPAAAGAEAAAFSATAGPPTAATAAAAAQKALRSLTQPSLYGPPSMLADGLKRGINKPHNWARLAQRLSTPGANITVAALGGSITAGYGLTNRKQSWAYQFVGWLQEAFPEVTISFKHNLGRDGIQINLASTCWYQYVPAAADIVLIDFNLNTCAYCICNAVTDSQIAAYENLLRRVIRLAPTAALLALDAFNFDRYNATNAASQQVLPAPFYDSGEEMHAMMTKRYRVSLTSARDAADDYVYSGQSAQRSSALGATIKQLMQDPKHPTVLGARLYGRGLAARAARQLLTAELTAIAAGGQTAADPAQQLALPPPVSPLAAQSADFSSFCAEGLPLKQLVDAQQVASQGWQWSVNAATHDCWLPNCRMLGYLGQEDGTQINLKINTAAVLAAAQAASSNQLANIKLILTMICSTQQSTLLPAGKTIKARAECVSGCSCSPMVLDGTNSAYRMMLTSTEVSAHSECVVRVTITGNSVFKVQGVAVEPYDAAIPYSYIDLAALRRSSGR